jgi:hypothetical protein
MVSADHPGQSLGVGLGAHVIQDLLTGRLQDRKTTAGFLEEEFELLMEARTD